MRIEHIIANIKDAAFEDDDRFQDVTFKLANWEDDWDAQDRNFRNYRNEPSEDLLRVIEHATRRGPNLELTITVQLGSVTDFPEDAAAAKNYIAELQRASQLVAEANAEADRIRAEAQAEAERIRSAAKG